MIEITPTWPASTTLLPSTLLPAIPVWAQRIAFSPTRVHAGVGLDLHVVLDDHDPRLRDFVMAPIRPAGEPISVGERRSRGPGGF